MAKDNLLVLESGVTKTASFNSTGLNIPGGTPVEGLVATLRVTTASGTVPTCSAEIEASADNTTYANVGNFNEGADITAAGEYFCRFQTRQPYVRLATTIGGTSPSFVYSAHVGQSNP